MATRSRAPHALAIRSSIGAMSLQGPHLIRQSQVIG